MPGTRSLTEQVVRYCAPTLANLKTGSLFSCGRCSMCDVDAEVRRLNRILVGKGLRLIPIVTSKQCVLIYLYRVKSLARDLSERESTELLKQCGYSGTAPERCVRHLAERIRTSEEFPHEIGLFLGYPPKDVKGFMEKGARDCIFCGKWKVYHDPENARKTFRSFEICEKEYADHYENGFGLERLAVAG